MVLVVLLGVEIVIARDLKRVFLERIESRSGLEAQRPYLGMSGIGNCARQLYDQFVKGRPNAQPGQHWRCWSGLLHEKAIGELLDGVVERNPIELAANFDYRYRGYVDFQSADGKTLVEIKSVTWDRFNDIRRNPAIPEHHYAQVQAYLQHGIWDNAILLYIARDTPNNRLFHVPVWTFDIRPDVLAGSRLDEKAKRILGAIDARTPPACMCGRHL